jgi:hypothetical protein
MANTPIGCTTTSGARLKAPACNPAPVAASPTPPTQRGARTLRAYPARRRASPPVAVRTAVCCNQAATAKQDEPAAARTIASPVTVATLQV